MSITGVPPVKAGPGWPCDSWAGRPCYENHKDRHCIPAAPVTRVYEGLGALGMGDSGKRKPADGSHILPNAIGKLPRLRLPLPPDETGAGTGARAYTVGDGS